MSNYLIDITQMIASASSTEIMSQLRDFAGKPLIFILFGVTVFLTGLLVVKRLVVIRAITRVGRIISGGGRRFRRRR